MSFPIIAVFGTTTDLLDTKHFEIRSAELSSAQTIEDAISSSDGVMIDEALPATWFAIAVALEKYGRPTAFIGDRSEFAATITHPTFLASTDPAAIRTFFTKHFPAPVDPSCEGDVCRI